MTKILSKSRVIGLKSQQISIVGLFKNYFNSGKWGFQVFLKSDFVFTGQIFDLYLCDKIFDFSDLPRSVVI